MKNEKLLAKHLLWPLIILTIALTGVAFFISFQALVDLATISGIPHPFLYPVIIDGFVVIAALWLLVFGKLYPKAKNYSWASLILFSAVSILGNALHAANHAETAIIQLWLATILSSFPAIALLIASHLLLIGMQVRYAHAVMPQRQSKPAKVEAATPAVTETLPDRVTAPVVSLKPATDELTVDEVKDRIRGIRARGEEYPTGADVGEWLGMSKKTGERRLAEIREELEQQEGLLLMNTNIVGGELN